MSTNTPLEEDRKLMRILGFLGGLPLGIFTGVISGFTILNTLDSHNTYDGFTVVYGGIAFGIVGAIAGIFIPKFILETLRSIVLLLIIILLPAYLFFLVNISSQVKDIDKDKFIIKGEKHILEKLNINVRYFMNEQKKPLYTIYYQGKNRFGKYANDYQYKNNINAREYEFFINYDDKLFSRFIVGNLKNCNNKVLLNSITIQSEIPPDRCLSEDFLNFIQNGNDIYFGCKRLSDDSCKKLNPLQGSHADVPDIFRLNQPIGLADIEENRNKRSFWMSLF